jgi:hypothetical protein
VFDALFDQLQPEEKRKYDALFDQLQPEEKRKYDALFDQLQPEDDKISGDKARNVMMSS